MRRMLAISLLVLFLSLSIAPAVRAEGLLSDFFNMIKGWFESSPLGNIFNAPVKRAETIKLTFYPDNFEINAADFINITTPTSEISNFKGTVSIDMKGKTFVMKEAGTQLYVKETIGIIYVDGLKLTSLDLQGMKLSLSSGNWNETTENGSVTLNDFLGRGKINEDRIELEGNVSRLVRG